MFTRTTGFVIVPVWLAAMSWLVAHDVWPGLTADDAPALQVTDWLKGEGASSQFAIFNDQGRLGTIWTDYYIDPVVTQSRDTIWIERTPIGIAPLRVTVDSVYTKKGILDDLTVQLESPTAAARVHGERFHQDFSFTLNSGTMEKTFKIPLVDGGMLVGGGLSPIASLTGLEVGQRWRIQVLNPIAVLLERGDRFVPMLVEVTGKETLTGEAGDVLCTIIESPYAKAWVDGNGSVQVQEITLPVIGRTRIVREANYDERARLAARRTNIRR